MQPQGTRRSESFLGTFVVLIIDVFAGPLFVDASTIAALSRRFARVAVCGLARLARY